MTIRFERKKKKQNYRAYIFAILIIALIFIFVPKMLFKRADRSLKEEMQESTNLNAFPSSGFFAAATYTEIARMFPGFSEKAKEINDTAYNFYIKRFNHQYSKLKYTAIDSAMLVQSITIKQIKDSLNKIGNLTDEKKSELNKKNEQLKQKILISQWNLYIPDTIKKEFCDNWKNFFSYFSDKNIKYCEICKCESNEK